MRLSSDAMSLIGDRTASFVVRIWRELSSDPSAAPEWRGSVECVSTEERMYFREFAALESFLRGRLSQIGVNTGDDPAGRPLQGTQPTTSAAAKTKLRKPRRTSKRP